jgi:hypothetical protein
VTLLLQGEVQELQEQLAAREAEAKTALLEAEATRAAAAAEVDTCTSRVAQQLQEAQV